RNRHDHAARGGGAQYSMRDQQDFHGRSGQRGLAVPFGGSTRRGPSDHFPGPGPGPDVLVQIIRGGVEMKNLVPLAALVGLLAVSVPAHAQTARLGYVPTEDHPVGMAS